jgi:HAD superfamily hydrolase (TIGR01509 family)
MMKKAHLDPYFDVMLSNEDVSRPKPDPEIYIKSMLHLGLTPDDCLVVEDNDNGIRAAKDSGAHVLAVQSVHDVTFDNITKHIVYIEKTEKHA